MSVAGRDSGHVNMSQPERHTWCQHGTGLALRPEERSLQLFANEATCYGHPNTSFSPSPIMFIMPTTLPDIPTKFNTLSASPSPGAASDDDTCDKELDEEVPPPLAVKATGYRLLIIATIVGFGIVKAVGVYCGQPLTPTTLEIVGGALITLMYAFRPMFTTIHTDSS